MFSTLFKYPQFFYKGFSEYMQKGYLENSKLFNPTALDVDIKEKVFIVTGANSGLGKEIALEIAKRGGKVHILCRNLERGEKALEELKSESGHEEVYLHQVDIGEMRSIKSFYEKFNEKYRSDNGLAPCHVLVHNAGMMFESYQINKEGIEGSFATNLLGQYYLTKLLLPNLEASQPSRVIMVSSGGMYTEKLNPKDLQYKHAWFYQGVSSYAQNKRQQVELTKKWAELYRGKGIRFFAMHPGWATTPGVTKSLPLMDKYIGQEALRTPRQGADTAIWLAISQEPYEYANGDFFFDRKPAPIHFPYSSTESTPAEVDSFVSQCEDLIEQALKSESTSQ